MTGLTLLAAAADKPVPADFSATARSAPTRHPFTVMRAE